ncbi:MAG: AmmeMemoRadiSam system protein B [Candidatus Aminicenantes bacterium]|nr:AmmeMemoRadiSam system protein B [Candidatus Aminicenantes bacterium]
MKGKTILFFGALMLLSTAFSFAQSIRKPVWAGQFYDADKAALAARIEGFLASARPAAVPGKIRALIVPHAGYIYSGRTAAFAYRLVQGEDIETVVILGPSHRVGFEGCSIYSEGGFETPLGIAEVDAPTARAIAGASGFGFVPEAHAEEHSVEVQVPFVQKVLPKAKIVPIVMGFPSEPNIRMLAGALAKVLKDRKALVIASTDMSHFLNQKEAEATDKSTLELVQDQKVPTLLRKIERNENVLCGGAAVVTALLYAQKMGSAAVTVLRRADSTEGGAPADSVVGYFSAAVTTRVQTQASNSGGENSSSPPAASARGGPSEFSAGAPAPQAAFVLSADEKKELLRLARQAVDLFVREGKTLDYETKNLNLLSPEGAFVTLKKKGELRGCIGFIEPVYPLYKAVIQCAVYAATEDPRFGPVSTSELKAIEVEISVLTPLKKIDDPDLVRVGKHGLVISSGGRRGLLLPQVPVENNWDRLEFLAQACLKAGLAPDAWRKGAEIYVFEAIVFK